MNTVEPTNRPLTLVEAFEQVQRKTEKKTGSASLNDSTSSEQQNPHFKSFVLKLAETLNGCSTITNKLPEPPAPASSKVEKTQMSFLEPDPFDSFLLRLSEALTNNTQTLETSAADIKPENTEQTSGNGNSYSTNVRSADTKKQQTPNNYVEILSKQTGKNNKTNKQTKLKKFISEQVALEINRFKQQLPNFGMFGGGGGGTNAVQYAAGGTMNGDLNVTGKILSGGLDLSTLLNVVATPPVTTFTDRLVAAPKTFILSSDGSFTFPDNTIKSSTGMLSAIGITLDGGEI